MRRIELLAPARTAEIGKEAFRHGADAVYIGAGRFSARSAAGNPIPDIEDLARYGHQFGACTIVAFNTILRDEELPEAERLTWQLYEAGVDALIVQDLGLLGLHLPPIPLHASTQTDNRTPEKVRLLSRLGFKRVVLARELSLDEIRAIHEAVPDTELECFVHGALCVCISGQCYLSAALTGRSANRGECAQPCRLPMDLLDDKGNAVVRQKHLLSLRDMNRSQYLQQLMEAGVTSLKIEGRLKDLNYVKNVVAYYRRQIDDILGKDGVRNRFGRVSEGRSVYTFTPNVSKSFNRGFTSYGIDGKREVMWNHESPKSMGELIGTVKEVGRDWFSLQLLPEITPLNNGDGLVANQTIGFRVNFYDPVREKIFPFEGVKICQLLRKGMPVHRNLDYAFEQTLEKKSAERRIPLCLFFKASPNQLELKVQVKDSVVEGSEATVTLAGTFEIAQKPQDENIRKQLSKLGDTVYEADQLEEQGGEWFVPSSMLGQLRRDAIAALDQKRAAAYEKKRRSFVPPAYKGSAMELDAAGILPSDFKANVMNRSARDIFSRLGIADVEPAFELQRKREGVVMQTRYCLKQAFGFCAKYPLPEGKKKELSTLFSGNACQLKIGTEKFLIKFGCKNSCISEIITIFAPEK
ncbi:MAG: U32 family peptidase [Bacteroidales bacterium]|nr:U32 family peptidase [Bacteroidales bacterium]